MTGFAEPEGVLMASATTRRFKDESKRDAVALWETSGRMQTEVAAGLGMMPTSTMASPADQACGIAR